MFYGEYKHGIDRKGRLILPSRFREIAKENGIEKFFLTRGLDKCIFMFSGDEWNAQEQKFKGMSFTRHETRSFNRLFFSGAVEVVPDRQGRFVLPQFLKDFAGIKRDAIIVGVSNRIEIWDADAWRIFYENSRGAFEDIAERMMPNV